MGIPILKWRIHENSGDIEEIFIWYTFGLGMGVEASYVDGLSFGL